MALPGFDTTSNPAPERVSNGVPRAGHHARLHGRARNRLGIDPGPLAARLRRAAVDRTRHPEPRHGRRLTRDPPPSTPEPCRAQGCGRHAERPLYTPALASLPTHSPWPADAAM